MYEQLKLAWKHCDNCSSGTESTGEGTMGGVDPLDSCEGSNRLTMHPYMAESLSYWYIIYGLELKPRDLFVLRWYMGGSSAS